MYEYVFIHVLNCIICAFNKNANKQNHCTQRIKCITLLVRLPCDSVLVSPLLLLPFLIYTYLLCTHAIPPRERKETQKNITRRLCGLSNQRPLAPQPTELTPPPRTGRKRTRPCGKLNRYDILFTLRFEHRFDVRSLLRLCQATRYLTLSVRSQTVWILDASPGFGICIFILKIPCTDGEKFSMLRHRLHFKKTIISSVLQRND